MFTFKITSRSIEEDKFYLDEVIATFDIMQFLKSGSIIESGIGDMFGEDREIILVERM